MSNTIKELNALTTALKMLRTERQWFYYHMFKKHAALCVEYHYLKRTQIINKVWFLFKITPLSLHSTIRVWL